MKAVLFKVKPGKLDDWLAWAEHLTQHEDEVLQTLKHERCIREQAILFSHDDTHYVFMSMEFAGEPVPSDQSVALNRQHRRVIEECLEKVNNGDTLYDFRRIPDASRALHRSNALTHSREEPDQALDNGHCPHP